MKIKLIVTAVCIFWGSLSMAQDIQGKWKTFNKHTGEVRSIIEVFEKDQKIYGRVFQIMDPEDKDNLCTACEGADKNKKIEGLVLIKNFKKEGDEYVDGTITNPDNGKVYDSKLWIDDENPNILHVRGYIGIFYKTMEWERLKTM
tara:strand:+ start:128 stop:562 length:435 start_codon:yes stop_codon:yes gene_type:complete